MRVAVVDSHDKQMGMLYKLILQRSRSDEVIICARLEEVRVLLQSHPPDIIWVLWSNVLDQGTYISEVEACQRIRSWPEGQIIPLIISTARIKEKQAAWDAGANGFLCMPNGPNEILKVRDAVLRGEKFVE